MEATSPTEPGLAVLHCVPSGTPTVQCDESVVTLELAGLELDDQHPEVLQAIRTHPTGAGQPGGRVAFLLMFSGYGEEQIRGISRDPELAKLPVFLTPVPPDDREAIERAVEDARRDLRRNPGFSIPVRAVEPDVAVPYPEDEQDAAPPVLTAEPRRRGLLGRLRGRPRDGGGRSVRADRTGPPEADTTGEEGALLSVAILDGPEATGQLRTRQRQILSDIQTDLSRMSRARWMLSLFKAGDKVERLSPAGVIPVQVPKRLGSGSADELGLTRIAGELLEEVNNDRQALIRRGWRISWSAILFLAPEFAYVGVTRNPSFAQLVADTDAVLWVGSQVDPLPVPLDVDGARFRAIHHDIAREVVDVLIAESGLPAEVA